MTKEQAYAIVHDTFDDDTLADDTLDELFQAIYDRPADADDREVGLWSLLCTGTPGLCGCSTRSEHEARHGCQTQARIARSQAFAAYTVEGKRA